MKLTYRDKIMLIGAVVIILWAIGIFLIIKPAFSDMDEKSKTKDSKDNEVVVLQQRVDQEASLKDDLQKAVYEVSAKLYQQAAPQQGAPDMGNAQPNQNNGGDPNVYDADFTDVDGNN